VRVLGRIGPLTIWYSMPCTASAFSTRQQGPALHGVEHRCSLTARLRPHGRRSRAG
jgi:hypothetical protein